MQTLKHPRWSALEPRHPVTEAAREWAAGGLVGISAALTRLATWLDAAGTFSEPAEPHFEFHAEAGAPEGALYCDGRLVGWIEGVKRL